MEIERKIPLEILRRLSMEEYDLDSEWIKAVHTIGTLYENYLRDRKLSEEDEPKRKGSLKRKSNKEDRNFNKKKRKVYTKGEKES